MVVKNRVHSYRAGILVRCGSITKRAVEVLVRNNDLYAFQPRKGASVKTSYHESGVFHVKVGPRLAISSARPHPPAKYLREDAAMVGALAECIYTKSLENYEKLLDLGVNAIYDETVEFDIDKRPGLYYVQIDVTNYPRKEADWEHLDSKSEVLKEQILLWSGFSFVARLRHLS